MNSYILALAFFRAVVFAACFLSMAIPVLAQATAKDKEYWNEIFIRNEVFRNKPSELLVSVAEKIKPGFALDLGMGQGRNALWLARQGWKVTGVDISEQGIEQSKKEASRLDLKINTLVEDLEKFDPGREQWDLILLFYMHGYLNDSSRNWPDFLWMALKPGGTVVIEGFAGDNWGFQPNQLIRKFAQFRIRFYEDTVAETDWGDTGKHPIVRLVAEKPGIHR